MFVGGEELERGEVLCKGVAWGLKLGNENVVSVPRQATDKLKHTILAALPAILQRLHQIISRPDLRGVRHF
jgi:hypothetical protein